MIKVLCGGLLNGLTAIIGLIAVKSQSGCDDSVRELGYGELLLLGYGGFGST